MKTKLFSLLLLFLISILLGACSSYQADKSLVQKRIDSLLVSDFFKSSQAAVSVYDLTNDKYIYQLNDKTLFHPASNQKILTTAAALNFLEQDFKFSTRLYYTGIIKDSICTGDLFVVGAFDPELTTKDIDALAKQIKIAGIKDVKGNLYGDVSAMDSIYWGNGWMWDDDPDSYIPYLTPLTINKNCIKIYYQPAEVGMPAHISFFPQSNFFFVKNNSITAEQGKNNLKVTRDWMNKSDTILASGTIPLNTAKDSVTLNIVHPEKYFLALLKDCLLKNGINLNGKNGFSTCPANANLIGEVTHNLTMVVNSANKQSDNLNAEMLLRTIPYSRQMKPVTFNSAKIFIDSLITLAHNNPKLFRIADGSGLSFYNLVSAELLVDVLKFMRNQKLEIRENFISSLAIAGIDGTLSNRFKNLSCKKHVFAKSGSISGVNNLSGYIETLRGNKLAFSILIQNFVGSSSKAREFQEQICEILFKEL